MMGVKNIFDTHCHYDDEAFDADREQVLSELLEAEDTPVCALLHASTDEASCLYGIKQAGRYRNYYTSIGFHPEACDRLPDDCTAALEKLLAMSEKIVAVGEVGLDYHYEGYDRELQIRILREQIDFANAHDLPLIFHCRDATQDMLDILHEKKPRGVMHCYSGAPEVAEELVKLGLYIGFTGLLTFKNAKKVKRSFEAVPLDRILLETDCPYMAPEPFRGRRCRSDMIAYTAQCGAELKGIDPRVLTDAARENAKRLFGIDDI